MNVIVPCRKSPGALLASAALAGALLITGCSDRDARLAESVAAAEQAARRAETAAERAEAAAGKAGTASAPVVIEEPVDEEAKAIEEANEPQSGEPETAN